MISEERMAQAAAQASEALQQYWNSCDMEIHEFSPRFQRKMRRLIGEVKHPYLHRALKSAACVLLVFLIGFASVLTFSVEARAAFVSWVKEIYEDSIVYRFYGDREESASLNYRVTWVPEGFELVEGHKSIVTRGEYYEKGDNILEAFSVYWSLNEDGDQSMIVTHGEYDHSFLDINGHKAELYDDISEDESDIIIWFDEEKSMDFHINYLNISLEDAIKIAESIVPVEEEKVYLDYHVTWVPEGYVLVDEVYENSVCFSIYDNPDTGDGFLFECYDLNVCDCMALFADDNYNQIEVMVNGIKADFYQSKVESESNNLIWHNENESLIFSVDSYLPMEDMIKIAESIQKVN